MSVGGEIREGRRSRAWRALKVALLAGVAGLLVIALLNVWMVRGARADTTTVAQAPHAQAAIVLGARVYPNGQMSPMLADRVQQGLALYRAGKVDKIIVSGDHGSWAYDEPGHMRAALLADGVPPQDVFTDHAGFDTWATMKRARLVFGVSSAVVVTQGFHLPRALYLAHAAGIAAHGVSADLRAYGPQEQVGQRREVAARLKAVKSAELNAKVMLGPRIPISGDGRVSWGPPGPPGSRSAE
jgi:SanA protein